MSSTSVAWESGTSASTACLISATCRSRFVVLGSRCLLIFLILMFCAFIGSLVSVICSTFVSWFFPLGIVVNVVSSASSAWGAFALEVGVSVFLCILPLVFAKHFPLLVDPSSLLVISLSGRKLDALFFWHGFLVPYLCRIKGVLREFTVESSNSSDSLYLIDNFIVFTLDFWLVLVLNGHAVDCVYLVQVPDATFNQFNKD